MKKIIKWLADISGVTRDTQIESYKFVGSQMRSYVWWWNGGIMHGEPKWDVWNAFLLYSKMLEQGHYGAVGSSAMEIRSKVYKLKEPLMP